MITRADIVNAAESWLGVPYHHQGRSRAAVDCIGLIVAIARELEIGRPEADLTRYRPRPDGRSFQAAMQQGLDEQPPGTDPLIGDVVLLRLQTPPRWPFHVGIIAQHPFGGPALIHAAAESGAVVLGAFDADYVDALVAVYHWPGVTYGDE